jgi:Flp pilus assembly protein TadG
MKPSVTGQCPEDRRDRQRGAALIELAVVVTVLSVVVLGTIDFGRIAYTAMALTNASRAGAMYGAQPFKSSDFTGMRNAASNSASADIGAIDPPVASRSCECEVAGTTTVIACNASCAGTLRVRVSVTASKTFNMLTRFPGLPNSVSLSRTAIMRAQ